MKARSKRNSRNANTFGFALLYAIFLAIAVEIGIIGSLYTMARHQREVQTDLNRVQMRMLNVSAVNEVLRNFKEYLGTHPNFPQHDVNSEVHDFDNPLSSWYNNASTGFKNRYSHVSGFFDLDLSNLKVRKVAESDGGGVWWREYEISSRVKSLWVPMQSEIKQKVRISNGKLFDFSIFSNVDLEIQGGPSFDLQGPIFSNGNIYLMNNPGSLLKLLRPSNIDSPESREPYIMRAAGNIYFGQNRAFAPNYLLTNAGYSQNVPSEYTDPLNNGLEINVAMDLSSYLPVFRFAPFIYHFNNGTSFKTASGGTPGNSPEVCVQNNQNCVWVDTGGTFTKLVPYHPPMKSITWFYPSYGSRYYTVVAGSQYGEPSSQGFISMSNAVDINNYPGIDPAWTPAAPTTYSPPVNPSWQNSLFNGSGGQSDVIAQGMPTRSIPIGDPVNPSGAHLLIEPIMDSDTTAIKESKFQQKAIDFGSGIGFNIHCLKSEILEPIYVAIYDCADAQYISPDFQALIDLNVAQYQNTASFFDFRIASPRTYISIDINKLLQFYPQAKMIYVRLLNGLMAPFSKPPRALRIINAKRLPKTGLTIATNGRIYIQGNYNTYLYENADGSSRMAADGTTLCQDIPAEDSDSGNAAPCYCTDTEWDNDACAPPPAAIFSDSFVALSSNWSDTYTSTMPPVEGRLASDTIINVGIATGIRRSQLLNSTYFSTSCVADMSNCEANGTWLSPDDSTTYYRGSDKSYYYVNKCSGKYLTAYATSKAKAGGDTTSTKLPPPPVTDLNDPAPECEAYNAKTATEKYNADSWRLPIFTDMIRQPGGEYSWKDHKSDSAPVPVRAFKGVYFRRLNSSRIFFDGTICVLSGPCPGENTICPDGTVCQGTRGMINNSRCTLVSAETGAYSCNSCETPPACTCYQGQACDPNAANFDPTVVYGGDYYYNLYTVEYSGGLENVVNLQENWAGKSLRFLGTTAITWYADGLNSYPYKTSYYVAPNRKFRYNGQRMVMDPPPGTPGTFAMIKKESTEKIY